MLYLFFISTVKNKKKGKILLLKKKLDLDTRNRAEFCFYLFLYKHFVFNSKLVYIIIYVCHFLKHRV